MRTVARALRRARDSTRRPPPCSTAGSAPRGLVRDLSLRKRRAFGPRTKWPKRRRADVMSASAHLRTGVIPTTGGRPETGANGHRQEATSVILALGEAPGRSV